MPIYEYKCQSCEHEFEELIFSRSMESFLSCPKCHDPKLSRLISACGFISKDQHRTTTSSSSSSSICSGCTASSCQSCKK